MSDHSADIELMMEKLFRFRRLGQEPREAMGSVLDHMIRPENPRWPTA